MTWSIYNRQQRMIKHTIHDYDSMIRYRKNKMKTLQLCNNILTKYRREIRKFKTEIKELEVECFEAGVK